MLERADHELDQALQAYEKAQKVHTVRYPAGLDGVQCEEAESERSIVWDLRDRLKMYLKFSRPAQKRNHEHQDSVDCGILADVNI